jgi:hypothetical protein
MTRSVRMAHRRVPAERHAEILWFTSSDLCTHRAERAHASALRMHSLCASFTLFNSNNNVFLCAETGKKWHATTVLLVVAALVAPAQCGMGAGETESATPSLTLSPTMSYSTLSPPLSIQSPAPSNTPPQELLQVRDVRSAAQVSQSSCHPFSRWPAASL